MSTELQSTSVTVSGVPIQVYGRAGDLYFDSIAAVHEVFEPAVAVARRLLDPTATFVDVGASIGLVSAAVSRQLAEGTVVALEPDERAFGCLERAVAGSPAEVSLLRRAVADEVSVQLFHQDPNGTAWGMLADREPAVEVEVTTVDCVVEELGLTDVDLIKVDVEGGELRVLEGARATIERHHPVLVIELNPYCLWRHGRTLPQDLVEAVQGHYPYVYAMSADGSFVELGPGRVVDDLLYGLGTTGGLADLIGSSEPIDLLGLGPGARSEDAPPAVAEEQVEIAAVPVPREWSPLDDLARVRRAVAWRLGAVVRKIRGQR